MIAPFRRRAVVGAALFGLRGLTPAPAGAAPEEIQVFTDDVTAQGALGLELHVNHVLAGRAGEDAPGEASSLHRLRFTPELSLGVGRGLQFGLLAPLATLDRRGRFDLGGAKLTAKYIAPRPSGRDWWYGANLEVGRTDRRLDVNPWNAELTGIVGTRSGAWLIAFNLAADLALAGPARTPLGIDLATKLTRAVGRHVAVGVESYNGAGDVRRLARFGSSDQSLFAVTDAELGGWEVNLGVGRGYGANPDRWLLKATIGVPIDRWVRRAPD